MKVLYHRKFKKNFRKLPKGIKKKVTESIALFKKDPFNPKLRNHALNGVLRDHRAFSITNDYRIIYEEWDNYVLVIMVDIGTHNQVY